MGQNSMDVNVAALYGFGDTREDHSGQFLRHIQVLSDQKRIKGKPFYIQLLDDILGPHTP